jgi:tRNA-Thr(GGU) m(6)t(6)A37 methyltransferase TsaA
LDVLELEKRIFEVKQIGVIYSPFKNLDEIPCQGYKSKGVGEIMVFEEYQEGLEDIEGFSHLILLYIFHRAEGYQPKVKPFLDEKPRGLFATRHYNRPNPIGISIVQLLEKKRNILKIKQVDVLDGTPLLDIKPYVPRFDQRKNVRSGWLENKLK